MKKQPAKCSKCGAELMRTRRFGLCKACRKAKEAERRWRYISVHETEYIQEIREINGLSPLKPKQRICLCCEKPFESWGPANRLCNACAKPNPDNIFHEEQRWPGQVTAGARTT